MRVPVGSEAVIGRSSAADITLADESISRRHVQIIVYDGHCLARDLGSTNGTYINGERLVGTRGLERSDKLVVGDHELRVSVGEGLDETT